MTRVESTWLSPGPPYSAGNRELTRPSEWASSRILAGKARLAVAFRRDGNHALPRKALSRVDEEALLISGFEVKHEIQSSDTSGASASRDESNGKCGR